MRYKITAVMALVVLFTAGCSSLPPVPEFKEQSAIDFVSEYTGLLYGDAGKYFSETGLADSAPLVNASDIAIEKLVRKSPETALRIGLLFAERAAAYWQRYRRTFGPDISDEQLKESRALLGRTVLEISLGRKLLEACRIVCPEKAENVIQKANEIIESIDREMIIRQE